MDTPENSLTLQPAFEVAIELRPGSDVLVRSIRLKRGPVENCFSFSCPMTLQEAFVTPLALRLITLIENIDAKTSVVEFPELTVQAPGVVMSGMSAEFSRLEGGPDILFLRFRDYLGLPTNFLAFDPQMEVTSNAMRERVALDVLRDVVTPLFDLISLARHSSSFELGSNVQRIEAMFERLLEQQTQVTFYSNLLGRYVAGLREENQLRRSDPSQIDTTFDPNRPSRLAETTKATGKVTVLPRRVN